MKIWCYDDAHYWGTQLAEVAQARGHDVTIFDAARDVGREGVLFYHMHHHPAVREFHKRALATFATYPDMVTIPGYKASVLYDDRIETLRIFGRWMPPTRIFTSPTLARDYIDSNPEMPIISKSVTGPGTRFLNTREDARKEIKHAFSDIGIKNRFNVYNHGALYWQSQIPNADVAYRVILVGNQVLVERQDGNRLTPIERETDEVASAIACARAIALHELIRFAGFDLVRSSGDGWYLMKIIAGWSMRRYEKCVFIGDGDRRTGDKFFEVLMEEIEEGNLHL